MKVVDIIGYQEFQIQNNVLVVKYITMTKKELKIPQSEKEKSFYCPMCARDTNKHACRFHKFIRHFDKPRVWVGCGCGYTTSTPQVNAPEETTKSYV